MAPLEAHPWRESETRFEWLDVAGAPISSQGVREECAAQGARSLYGLTKFASEGLIEEYRAGFGLRAAINRCGVIAGPWQMGKVDQGVVSLWVLRHYFGKPLSYIGYGGTGKQVRDVLHVDDLCELVEEQLANFDRLGRLAGKCRWRAGNFRFASRTDRRVPESCRTRSAGWRRTGKPAGRPADFPRRLFQIVCANQLASANAA